MAKSSEEISKLALKSENVYMSDNLNKDLPKIEAMRTRIGYYSGYLHGYEQALRDNKIWPYNV